MTMRKRKWFVSAIVLSVLLIGGTVGGLVAAAEDSAGHQGKALRFGSQGL